MADLAVQLAGIPLRNPLIAASGTCGYINDLTEVMNPAWLGAMVTKSITVESRVGNPTWRILDAPAGMLNAIGLANVGLEKFLAEKLPAAPSVDTVIIGSIAGASIEDYVRVATTYEASEHLCAMELNVSCPNTSDGLVFGEDPKLLRELVSEVRQAARSTKVLVKLSPNVPKIAHLAQAAIDGGADALTMINTVNAMAIDVETRAPRLSNRTGGLSGPAIHPIAVRMIDLVYRSVARDANIPIVGLGGVMNWRDAAEFILAGATCVGLGTALFADPAVPKRIARGLEKWVERQGCRSITQLIGQVQSA